MNKMQIICPLVAPAIAALVLTVIYGRRHQKYYLSARAVEIGNQLVAATNSPYLVRIGQGLQDKLSQFLTSESQLASVADGDAPPPIGDGKAQRCVFLRNSKGELLGIRLRQSHQADKFEVLGHWTPRPEVENGAR